MLIKVTKTKFKKCKHYVIGIEMLADENGYKIGEIGPIKIEVSAKDRWAAHASMADKWVCWTYKE